jgi:hypothetical protein
MPPNYARHHDLFGDWEMPAWRLLVYANLLALIPLAIAALCLWLPYQGYVAFGAPYALPNPDLPAFVIALMGIAIIALSVILHELLHGVALRLMGFRPRLSFASGYLYATMSDGQYLTRRQYVMMALTPLVVITGIGAGLLVIVPVALGQWLMIALLLNAAASIGDLVVTRRALAEPSYAYFAADEEGIQVYLPAGKANPPSPRAQP